MPRPHLPATPSRVLATIAAGLLLGLVVSYLLTQPYPTTGQVVSVDADGHVTD